MNTELGKKIADKLKEEKIMKIKMFKKHSNESSANNMHNMWKLKKKLFPKKAPCIPSAKLNYQGRIISEPNELKKLIGNEYGKIRLRPRPIHPKNKMMKQLRNK